MKHLPSIITAFVCTAFAGVIIAHAQGYTPLAPLPGTFTETAGVKTTDLSLYLSGAIKLLIALGAGLAILFAIIGGTQYVAASINLSAKKDALERIWNALIGLAIILTSYLLLNSINPKLVGGGFLLPAVTSVVPTAGVPLSAVSTSMLVSTPPPPTTPPPAIAPATTASTPANTVAAANAQAQAQINALIDRTNDFSIISHCPGNTTYDLCLLTDLNSDGKTDLTDIALFASRGSSFDTNGNKTVELANLATPVSCFFKTSTVNVQAMLPRLRTANYSGGGFGMFFGTPANSCSGDSVTTAPTVACNGATWLTYSKLGGACAANSGLLNMPFGYVYTANGTSPGAGGSDGQYSNFQIWITGALSGSAVNLSSLFAKTFLNAPTYFYFMSGTPVDPYLESNLGKVTYATIAQYDLNDDGIADFSASGADMTAFNACKGLAVSGACAQADFNGDDVVDGRDVFSIVPHTVQHPFIGSFVDLIRNYLSSGPQLIPGWKLGDFESNFFDPAGYSDKQIINYCIGHKAWFRCAVADINKNNIVDSSDLMAFTDVNTGAPRLDFNGDGVVNLK